MSRIESIKEESITGYVPLVTSGGKTLVDDIEKLIELYQGVSTECFGAKDASTAKDAVDMMIRELTDLKYTVVGAEAIVDTVVKRIREDIIEEEDSIAKRI